MPGPADAGTPLTVTRFDDPPPGTCDSNDCSLREAIIAANAAAGADTITLPANPYSLSISGTDDDATAGDLDITDDLTINGAGSATTIIDGGAIDRVFNVRLASGTVSISGVTIQNGRTPSYENGGGIFNELAGTLTITNSVVKANNASYGGGIYNNGTLNLTDSAVSDENVGTNGGGIINDGTLTMTNSTVSGNFGSGSGGGVFNQGTATIIRSTVSGNLTTYSGGAGIYNESNLIITNSTVSGNLAATDGGGIQNSNLGTATITNSTITNNTADREGNEIGDGGGIASSGDTVSVKNTIVAGNADLSSATVEPDCFGTLSSQGHNFIETVSPGCIVTGATAGNVTGQPAGLGPLALNSPGTTQTHALLAGSPAIDAGSLDCPPPATDQRGVVRAQGGACDIGAYESPFTAPTLTPSPTPSPTPSASPTPTSSPTPTASPTPTPTHSPTPTGTHAAGLIQGDVTCDGSVGQPDFDFLLRFAAGLNDGTTPGDCPDLGEISIALAVAFSWGDVNCDGVVDAIDALYVLAHTVNVDLPQIGVNCIPIGGNIP